MSMGLKTGLHESMGEKQKLDCFLARYRRVACIIDILLLCFSVTSLLLLQFAAWQT